MSCCCCKCVYFMISNLNIPYHYHILLYHCQTATLAFDYARTLLGPVKCC
jgi:hypothetical protein